MQKHARTLYDTFDKAVRNCNDIKRKVEACKELQITPNHEGANEAFLVALKETSDIAKEFAMYVYVMTDSMLAKIKE